MPRHRTIGGPQGHRMTSGELPGTASRTGEAARELSGNVCNLLLVTDLTLCSASCSRRSTSGRSRRRRPASPPARGQTWFVVFDRLDRTPRLSSTEIKFQAFSDGDAQRRLLREGLRHPTGFGHRPSRAFRAFLDSLDSRRIYGLWIRDHQESWNDRIIAVLAVERHASRARFWRATASGFCRGAAPAGRLAARPEHQAREVIEL